MPYLAGLALDRINEQLVKLRLGSRLPKHCGTPVVEYLQELGDHVHPDPQTMAPLEPESSDGQRFSCSTPWPEAEGNNVQWTALRIPARGVSQGVTPPSLILLHGWLIDRPQLYVYRSWARQVARRGVDVWIPWLPFHMNRAEADEVSGQRCLTPEISTSLDAVRQAVLETRALARWLRSRGAPKVGVWGMSLGAWVASLSATLDDDWDGVALWAPVADPAEVLFESGLVELLREAILEGGLSEDDFDAPEMAFMTPARRSSAIDRSRILMVAGAYDQVIAPRSIARLARHWNIDVRWVPHGHISLMASRAPVKDTARFLGDALAGSAPR